MTALGTVAAVATLFTGLYPRVMVSSPNFANSLDVRAASAHYTLAVMSVVAADRAADRPALPELVVLRLPRAGRAARRSVRPRRSRARPAARRPADHARARPAPCAPGPSGAPPARARRGPRCLVRGARPRPGGADRESRGAGVLGRLVRRCHVRARSARARVRRAERADVGLRGGRPAAPRRPSSPSFGSSSSSAGSAKQPLALDGAECRRDRGDRRAGRRRARGLLRPLSAAGRARARRPRGGARAGRARSTPSRPG